MQIENQKTSAMIQTDSIRYEAEMHIIYIDLIFLKSFILRE